MVVVVGGGGGDGTLVAPVPTLDPLLPTRAEPKMLVLVLVLVLGGCQLVNTGGTGQSLVRTLATWYATAVDGLMPLEYEEATQQPP